MSQLKWVRLPKRVSRISCSASSMRFASRRTPFQGRFYVFSSLSDLRKEISDWKNGRVNSQELERSVRLFWKTTGCSKSEWKIDGVDRISEPLWTLIGAGTGAPQALSRQSSDHGQWSPTWVRHDQFWKTLMFIIIEGPFCGKWAGPLVRLKFMKSRQED